MIQFKGAYMTSPLPRVNIVATGGSIAGIGPHRLDYTQYAELNDRLTIKQSLERVPEVNDIAEIHSEDMFSVGSTAIGPSEWVHLAQRINSIFRENSGVSGVVVTHGTATLEETSYFLNLTIKDSRPVVVTGAMRPPSAISTDADINLLDAVRVAASPTVRDMGVLAVLNNEIHSARDVMKINTFRVETFSPGELGFLGYADSDGQIVFYRMPTRKHTTGTAFDVTNTDTLPIVDIVYAYGGADGLLIDAVRDHGSHGLIIAGFGGGTYPPKFLKAAVRAVEHGIPVVLASRSPAGRVIMTPKKEEQGFIVSDNLSPQKARILLMLTLMNTQDRKVIQEMFNEY